MNYMEYNINRHILSGKSTIDISDREPKINPDHIPLAIDFFLSIPVGVIYRNKIRP